MLISPRSIIGIPVYFRFFFLMKVCCVFSLESHLMSTHNIPIQCEKGYFPKSAAMGFFPWGSITSSKHPW